MAEIIKLFNELKKDYNQEKERPEKFIASLEVAEESNKTLLDNYEIHLKPSAWSVLSIEPEILEKTLLRAKDFGFLDAYQQNPAFLKQDIDKVIKRIGELEAYGIPYKNEKGRYQSFLFSQRGFSYALSQSKGIDYQAPTNEENNLNVDISEIKRYADRIMETFSITDEMADIYRNIESLANSGFSTKEILMQVFKAYGNNTEYLSNCIDEILMADEEIKMGRVA